MGKKTNPPGIKLTLKTAKELAKRELGTAKGMAVAECSMKGHYDMSLGDLAIHVYPEQVGDRWYIALTARWASGISKTIQLFDPETLEKDGGAEEEYWEQYRIDLIRDWVDSHGVMYCCEKLNEAWFSPFFLAGFPGLSYPI